MPAITAYIDTSGSLSEVVVAPACLAASPEEWEEFDKRWDSWLFAFGITAMHMEHFSQNKGEFQSWGLDLPKKRRLVRGLLEIIEDGVQWTAAASVYTDDFRYVDERHYRLSEQMRPYTMGCLLCVSAIMAWAKKKEIAKNDLIWVFEKGDQDQDDLKKRWEIAYPDSAVDPIFCKKRDTYPDKSICAPIRAFEAADLIAYQHLQAHRILLRKMEEGTYDEELHPTMQRMMKNWPSSVEWSYCDKKGIEQMCEKWNIPPRNPNQN